MARKRENNDNRNHEGGGPNNNQNQEEHENENSQGDFDRREGPKYPYETNQGTANPGTDRAQRGKSDDPDEKTSNRVSLGEAGGRLKGFRKFLTKVRDMGEMTRMPGEEVFRRDRYGNLMHTDYMIHMGNKAKNIQMGTELSGKGLNMFADAVEQYERGRRLR